MCVYENSYKAYLYGEWRRILMAKLKNYLFEPFTKNILAYDMLSTVCLIGMDTFFDT